MDEIINKVVVRLEGQLSKEDIRKVRDAMQMVMIGYNVEPISTEVVKYDYQLPECYRYYMAAKTMDGKLSEKSVEQYKLCLESMLHRLQLPVGQITAKHLRGYLLEISHKPDGTRLAAATLNQRKSIIRSFFQWLSEEDFITNNPALRLHHEKVSVKPEPVFTDIQLEEIRDACDRVRDAAIIELLVSSGIRINECSCLKKEDVDLDSREATVLGKGSKYRTVYFSARAEFLIRSYLQSRTDDSPYLFVTLRNPHRMLKTNSIRDIMKKISNESGIPKIHPHRFRHTMATNLVEKGCDITDVQQMLGHTKLDTTMRYTHTSKKKVKAAHERFA